MTATVSKALEQKQNTLAHHIDRMQPEIARALPKHMTPDRLARIATTVMRQTPALGGAGRGVIRTAAATRMKDNAASAKYQRWRGGAMIA